MTSPAEQFSRFRTLSAAAAGVLFVVLCTWAWRFTMEDAYISLRYAKHLGDGIGPIWNLVDGNDPVEGFTSFLHVWLLGAFRFVTGMELEIPAKLLGVASVVCALLLVVRADARLGPGRLGTLTVLSPFVLPYLALHAVSGMETGLHVLLQTGCALVCVRLLDSPTKRSVRLFVVLGLLTTMTRPDFGATFIVLCVLVAWRLPEQRRELFSAFRLYYVLPGVLMTGFRLAYYGDVVPNAFYRKQRLFVTDGGVHYVTKFYLLVAAPFLLMALSGWRRLRDDHNNLLIVTGLCLAIPSVYFATTRPWMGWWFRFLLAQLPMLGLLAAAAVKSPLRSFRGLAPARVGLLVLILGLAAAYLPAIEYALVFQVPNQQRLEELGRRLASFAREDRWMNYYDVGQLVYSSEWNTRDVMGLNTRPSKLGNLCDTRTDLILRSRNSQPAVPREEIENPCPDSFSPIADLPFISEPPLYYRYMRVFARNDIDYKDELAAKLLDDWPGVFSRPPDWKSRYTRQWFKWAKR